jgi:hypothetical protein
MKTKFTSLALICGMGSLSAASIFAQTNPSDANAQQQYKYQTPALPGVATPDTLDTSIGTLHLKDGYPLPDTVEKIYDNLDRSRALQAFLLGLPIVEQAAMRDALRKLGPDNQTDFITENLTDSRTIQLTENDDTIYNFIWLDTHKGPLVLEIPPRVLGIIDDFWYHWSADAGITGADKGQGGKYLVLPPDYKDDVPSGYFVVRPATYGNWLLIRGYLVNGSTKPAVESIKKNLKIYYLADAANPPTMNFINGSGIYTNFDYPTDFTYWTLLNQAIQEEPSTGSDPTTLGLFASIGIVKGKPFDPDPRMKKILEDAANIGAVTARAITYKMRNPDAYYYPNSSWRLPYLGGYKFQDSPGVSNLDGAINFFYLAGGDTPAMEQKMVGQGSQYPWAVQDSQGNPFDGAKTYKLHLPPNVPAKDFWSAVVYDNQTRSLLQTDQQFPSVSSHTKGLKTNADGSVDIYFASKAPAGYENNWVQTIPGKGWFVLFRLYGPLEPWFDKTWKLPDIDEVK